MSLDRRDGHIINAGTDVVRLGLSEIARLVYFRSDMLPPWVQADLTVAHHHAPRGYPFAFSNGIHASRVEVDAETGFVAMTFVLPSSSEREMSEEEMDDAGPDFLIPVLIERELRIRDVDLAVHLGFARPTKIRELIRRHHAA